MLFTGGTVSLYAAYMQEREACQVIEWPEKGFISYKIEGAYCGIHDLFVAPSLRRSRVAWELADQVAAAARAHGCMYLAAFCDPRTFTYQAARAAILAYGFKFHTIVPDGREAFRKEL